LFLIRTQAQLAKIYRKIVKNTIFYEKAKKRYFRINLQFYEELENAKTTKNQRFCLRKGPFSQKILIYKKYFNNFNYLKKSIKSQKLLKKLPKP
jgi:hypothetical protein